MPPLCRRDWELANMQKGEERHQPAPGPWHDQHQHEGGGCMYPDTNPETYL